MSLSSANLLLVIAALTTKVEAASNIDFVFPTGTRFAGKADYWTFANTLIDTKKEIDTTLIRCAWINYLRTVDTETDRDAPVKIITYGITVFHETAFTRLDETASPDAFNAKIALADHEHDTAIFGLQIEFQGVNPLGLSSAVFAVDEVQSIIQPDNTVRFGVPEYIPDTAGNLTKLECEVKLLLVAC